MDMNNLSQKGGWMQCVDKSLKLCTTVLMPGRGNKIILSCEATKAPQAVLFCDVFHCSAY